MTGDKQECLQLSPEGRDRLRVIWQSVPGNGDCDRKRATAAGCGQTVLRDVQLQRERRPQTATTWQAWYRNELIRWRQTVQHSVCHERQFKLTRSGRRSQCNIATRGRQTRGRSDKVGIPSELQGCKEITNSRILLNDEILSACRGIERFHSDVIICLRPSLITSNRWQRKQQQGVELCFGSRFRRKRSLAQ